MRSQSLLAYNHTQLPFGVSHGPNTTLNPNIRWNNIPGSLSASSPKVSFSVTSHTGGSRWAIYL